LVEGGTRHARHPKNMRVRLAFATMALVVALTPSVGVEAQATPAGQTGSCNDAVSCPELVTPPSPEIQVAGVQVSADDARQPGETEPFIVNSGFGD
jgi:hypothetical protein